MKFILLLSFVSFFGINNSAIALPDYPARYDDDWDMDYETEGGGKPVEGNWRVALLELGLTLTSYGLMFISIHFDKPWFIAVTLRAIGILGLFVFSTMFTIEFLSLM